MNPSFMDAIGNLYGPTFLLLYAFVVGVVLVMVFLSARSSDRSRGLPRPPLPVEPDPFEIAFLRGGRNELIRIVVLDLVRRGYLQVAQGRRSWLAGQGDQMIERHPEHPDPASLEPMDRAVFDYFLIARTAAEMFDRKGLAQRIEPWCGPYEQRLRQETLLMPQGTASKVMLMRFWGVLVIGGLGAFKLAVALSKGKHNVGFLIAMAILGILMVFVVSSTRRLTHRGREYLRSLKTAFGGPRRADLVGTTAGTPNDGLLLMASVAGLSALDGSPHSDYRKVFAKSTASSGSSCGGYVGCGTSGGSGGSSDAGSSCGGGGCGGAGCGGCGGS